METKASDSLQNILPIADCFAAASAKPLLIQCLGLWSCVSFVGPPYFATSFNFASKLSRLPVPTDLFSDCVSRVMEYSLDGHNASLSAIRTVRVLRPLRAINRVPSKSTVTLSEWHVDLSSSFLSAPHWLFTLAGKLESEHVQRKMKVVLSQSERPQHRRQR